MKCSELLRLLRQAGWYDISQRGSHIKMKHPDRTDFIMMPNHGSREIEKGLEKKDQKASGPKSFAVLNIYMVQLKISGDEKC